MAEQKFYIPTSHPMLSSASDEVRQVVSHFEGELRAIAQQFQELNLLKLEVLHVEPIRPRDGMLVAADGSDWDPGDGAGVYARISGSWVALHT